LLRFISLWQNQIMYVGFVDAATLKWGPQSSYYIEGCEISKTPKKAFAIISLRYLYTRFEIQNLSAILRRTLRKTRKSVQERNFIE
jgi:hypothetical protein